MLILMREHKKDKWKYKFIQDSEGFDSVLNVNNIFNDEIDRLKEMLIELNKLNIKRIFFWQHHFNKMIMSFTGMKLPEGLSGLISSNWFISLSPKKSLKSWQSIVRSRSM